MAQNFDDFRRMYFRERRPMVGDPMVGDTATRPPFTAAGQGQPNPTPLPHEIPHSQPPGGPTQPITPNTRPLPNQPPPVLPRR
jgi:hypothetical protein